MVPLRAEILTDLPIWQERSAARRTLRLKISASSSEDSTTALIHNISEKGLLLETAADLQVGEALQVDLPHAGTTTALVIWNRGAFRGCEFASPVSKAAVSAALLLAPGQPTQPPKAQPAIEAVASAVSRPLEEVERFGPAAVIISLLIMLFVVVAFLVALATFPFSI